MERKGILMLLKVGINRRGINGNIDTYVYNEKYSFSDIDKMEKIANDFVKSIPIEYDEIEIYSYDVNAILKLEFMEVVKAFINSERKIKAYHMIYEQESEKYIRHRIK